MKIYYLIISLFLSDISELHYHDLIILLLFVNGWIWFYSLSSKSINYLSYMNFHVFLLIVSQFFSRIFSTFQHIIVLMKLTGLMYLSWTLFLEEIEEKRAPEMDTNGFHGDTFSGGWGAFHTAKKRHFGSSLFRGANNFKPFFAQDNQFKVRCKIIYIISPNLSS